MFLAALVVAGCMSQAQFLATKQPTAIQAALTRGQFELNCPSATGEVLSQEVTQPVLQGPVVQGEERGLFTIGVAGCNERRVYQVLCPMGETAALRSKVASSEEDCAGRFRVSVFRCC